MPLKVGIAFYIQEGNNRAGPPHWALVAHPISYSAPDVMVFQIRQVLPSSWSLAHTVCSLSNTSALLGVLHVAEISMTSVAPWHNSPPPRTATIPVEFLFGLVRIG